MSTNSPDVNNNQASHSNCTPSSAGRAASPLTWWAAAAFASIVGFSRISYGLLLSSVRMDLRGNYGAYGLIGTANFVGYLLGTLVVPLLLASSRDRIKLNSGALMVMNVALLLSATSLNLLQLGIWRFLIGFCSAPALVLTLALTLEQTAPGERGRASGIVWMGASVGIILSGVIAPLVISTGLLWAWRLAWSVMGIGGGATVLGFHRTLCAYDARRLSSGVCASDAQPTKPEANPIALLVELLRPRGFLFATLSYFGYGFGYIIYLTFFVALVLEQGLSPLLVSLIWAAMGATGAISGLIWGRAVDRWPTGFTLAITLGLGALGTLSVLTHHILLEAVGAAVFGLSVFLGPPLIVTSLLRQVVPGDRYASSYSLLNALFGIGQILGPLVGGLVVDQLGLMQGTALTALVLCVAMFFALGYEIVQRHG
jgi:predicted MFS family arabinose efflux permease